MPQHEKFTESPCRSDYTVFPALLRRVAGFGNGFRPEYAIMQVVIIDLKDICYEGTPGNRRLAGEAYLILRERILRGELAIGQSISRRKLAVELGMSFLPVSEALLRLENEGWSKAVPPGTRVRLPTREDVQPIRGPRGLGSEVGDVICDRSHSRERSELMRLAIRVDSLSTQTESNG